MSNSGIGHGIARASIAAIAFLAGFIPATPAWAYWSSSASAHATATTGILRGPIDVTLPATAVSDVAIGWSTGVGDVDPAGFYVSRHSASSTEPACETSPAVLVHQTSCTDLAVADGDYTYVVTAVYGSWTEHSATSSVVTVMNVAALAFTAQPSDATVGLPMTSGIVVALRTDSGSAIAAAGIPVTIAVTSDTDAAELEGLVTVDTDADGVATFADLSFSVAGEGYQLTASSPGVTPASSEPISVLAPPEPAVTVDVAPTPSDSATTPTPSESATAPTPMPTASAPTPTPTPAPTQTPTATPTPTPTPTPTIIVGDRPSGCASP